MGVVGMYELEESTGKRHGQLALFSLSGDKKASFVDTFELPGEGVLDCKWKPSKCKDDTLPNVLLSAHANGALCTFSFDERKKLRLLSRSTELAEHGLALSVGWSRDGRCAVASFHDGTVSRCRVDGADGSLCVEQAWPAHDMEAWSAAIDQHNDALMYSGSDDCRLRGWDARMLPTPTFTRRYDMGVTTMEAHPSREHVLAVGSYDESVTVYDTRAIRSPLATVSTGGGVWRLRWHPSEPTRLLAACMRAGFAIVDVDFEQSSSHVSATLSEPHASEALAYGADWSRANDNDGAPSSSVLAVCSFYDRLFSVWQLA
jgi:diphthine methyl ester acylhydrolase